ncbi:hypothetical protein [Brevundimonas sp. FT23028]|uniref:hypothetical protein n=1 Tax=Brevundimonas sp. FT23028 TaxID=3393748 RepID=UPI003B589F63
MRIKITGSGIFNSEGQEIEVGTELDVKNEPTGWAGRYEIISGGNTKGKKGVTNPKDGDTKGLKAEHHGGGKFKITRGEETLLSDLSKADADAFNALSEEDKAAFVADQKKS